ncbi:unnamed protein product [Rhodiola kirilowii]
MRTESNMHGVMYVNLIFIYCLRFSSSFPSIIFVLSHFRFSTPTSQRHLPSHHPDLSVSLAGSVAPNLSVPCSLPAFAFVKG